MNEEDILKDDEGEDLEHPSVIKKSGDILDDEELESTEDLAEDEDEEDEPFSDVEEI